MSGLSRFLKRAKEDVRVGPWHVSLYVVLLDICKGGGRPGMFAINRDEVMAKAKIHSRGTYYRLMKELAEWGYVIYAPERWWGKVGIVRIYSTLSKSISKSKHLPKTAITPGRDQPADILEKRDSRN